jgi:hypothetical protein
LSVLLGLAAAVCGWAPAASADLVQPVADLTPGHVYVCDATLLNRTYNADRTFSVSNPPLNKVGCRAVDRAAATAGVTAGASFSADLSFSGTWATTDGSLDPCKISELRATSGTLTTPAGTIGFKFVVHPQQGQGAVRDFSGTRGREGFRGEGDVRIKDWGCPTVTYGTTGVDVEADLVLYGYDSDGSSNLAAPFTGVTDPLGSLTGSLPEALRPSQEENVARVAQPEHSAPYWFGDQMFFGSGFASYPGTNQPDHYYGQLQVSVAVGGGAGEDARVYVASDLQNRVYIYNAVDGTPLGSFGGDGSGPGQFGSHNTSGVGSPSGIAYYRSEVYVADPVNKRIQVFDRDGNYEHQFKPLELPGLIGGAPRGIAVGWGEVWTVTAGPVNAGTNILQVLDAQTGAPKAMVPVPPRERCYVTKDGVIAGPTNVYYPGYTDGRCPEGGSGSDQWWDVSLSPELHAAIADYRAVKRNLLLPLTATPDVLSYLSDTYVPLLDQPFPDSVYKPCYTSCELPIHSEGTGSAWGMRWQEAVRGDSYLNPDGSSFNHKGDYIDSFSIDTDNATRNPTLAKRRTWTPRQSTPGQNCSPYSATNCTVSDVAYNNRELRIDWKGTLATSKRWLRGRHCLDYVVSRADIYAVGDRAEHWLELANGFQSIEFFLDGQSIEKRTGDANVSGTFCLDTANPDRTRQEPHTLTAIAEVDPDVNQGTRQVTKSRNDLRIDNHSPTGSVSDPKRFIRDKVTVTGTLADDHAGPDSWQLQAIPDGGNWRDICPPQRSDDTPSGNYSCDWNTNNGSYADGWYTIHARLLDKAFSVDSQDPFGNQALPERRVMVDNTNPTLDVSGELQNAANLEPLHPNQPPNLHVDAADAGSGARSIEIRLDGNPVDQAHQDCPDGGCNESRDYTFDPSGTSDGKHTIQVVVTDGVGLTASKDWVIDVQNLPPPPDSTDSETQSSDDTGAQTAAAAATPGVAGVAASAPSTPSVPNTTAADSVIPCEPDGAPVPFPYFSLGSSFDGLPATATFRRCDLPDPEEGFAANFVSYIYGDCQPTGDPPLCGPPVEIQTWPACQRNLAQYDPQPGVPPYVVGPTPDRLDIRGVPAALFENGLRLEIYTGRSTVVLFGQSRDQVLRAADSVQQETAPGQQWPPTPLDSTNVGNPLPPPDPGALNGTLDCR